jgi:hypothetical protein
MDRPTERPTIDRPEVGPIPVFADGELQRAFEHRGYVAIDLLDRDEIAEFQRVWTTQRDPVQSLSFGATMLSRNPTYRREISRAVKATLTPHLRRLMPGLRMLVGAFGTKCGQDERSALGMHQDPSYVDESAEASANVWIPLVDTNDCNGALWIVPGSHRINPQPRAFRAPFPYPELDSVLRETYARPLYVAAGTAIVINQALFHFSPPNRSESVRIATGGVVIGANAQPRFLCDNAAENRIDVYDVPDDFYCWYELGTTPEFKPVAAYERRQEPLDLADLERILAIT